MGLADVITTLWRNWLKHNPNNPDWQDRDRFVLSNGHSSMLLYAALHLSGYSLSLDDLRNFRQLSSATPGHPERGQTAGVEVTTGPLGQGFANAVGMAIAEKKLAAHYNRPGFPIVDHRTWVILGDGCLMEGISHEAASLASVLQLGKLIAIYDDNGISIDGEVSAWMQDDTPERFRAYGWQVIDSVDGHDPEAFSEAISKAVKEQNKPSLICTRTIIGFGSPNKQGQAAVHGAALGEEEVAATRKALGWEQEPFCIEDSIYAQWDCKEKGSKLEAAWYRLWQDYRREYPKLARNLQRQWSSELPDNFVADYQQCLLDQLEKKPTLATRAASKVCLETAGALLPELIGGAADLTDSCCTRWSGCTTITADSPDGNYLHYGVREFAMSAVANGIAAHGGLRPYTGTFLVFSDYARNAVRMAALMKLPQIFVYTHDSIGLGEDGPTHQPIEQLTHLRSTPELTVWRPCDALETAVAWRSALVDRSGPSALVLSRQKLPSQMHDRDSFEKIARGGYILVRETDELQLILIATGSEVELAVKAHALLAHKGVRVVSLPSVEVFAQQDEQWREQVLPSEVRLRLAIEAAHPDYWYRWVGFEGAVMGIDRFGESAPGQDVAAAFGFTPDRVASRALALLKGHTNTGECNADSFGG